MMRLSLVYLVAFVVCACAAEEDDVPALDGLEVAGTVYLMTDSGEISMAIEDSMCDCRSSACDEKWVREHVGCNVCVLVLCTDSAQPSPGGADPAGADTRAACVFCPNIGDRVLDRDRPRASRSF